MSPVETVIVERPETLSATVHVPPTREYDTSDIMFPPALYFLNRIAPPSRFKLRIENGEWRIFIAYLKTSI